MGSITDYLENKLAAHVFTATAYTPPTTVYLGLSTADPTDAATGAACNEVSNTGNYARTAITFSAASARSVAQSATVTYPTLNGAPGTASHWFIADSPTYGAGNVLAIGALSPAKALVSGNTPSIASGVITVSYNAGGCSDYLANKLLDFAFRNVAYTRPSTYLALTTATIADANTGSTITEPSGNAYARHQVTAWTVTSSVADNTGIEAFTAATGSWGTLVATSTVDAASAGNLLTYDNSMTDQAVTTGDTMQFAAGAYDNTFS